MFDHFLVHGSPWRQLTHHDELEDFVAGNSPDDPPTMNNRCVRLCGPETPRIFRKMIPKFAICYVEVYHCIMAYPIFLDLWTTTSNSHGWAHGRFPEFHRVPMRERLS